MKRTKIQRLISYVVAGICALGLAGIVCTMITEFSKFTVMSIIGMIIEIPAIICAIVYLVRGYQKTDAKIFKAFLIQEALSFIVLITSFVSSDIWINAYPHITRNIVVGFSIAFAIVFFLLFAENPGEKKSKIFTVINIALMVVLLMICLFTIPNKPQSGDVSLITITTIITAAADMALVNFICVMFKYADKKQRGTK